VHVDADTLILFGGLIVAVILHEISHGVVALWLGDDTAKRAGRLTLNPIPHIDPFGSIILPALGALSGVAILGYAKPVPVNPGRLHNPKRDYLWVSLAGPATNLFLMSIAALAAHFVFQGITHPGSGQLIDYPLGFRVLFLFAIVNLGLGVFNLLPIPPLDGSAIFEQFMPDSWRPGWYRFRQYGILILFALVFWTGLGEKVIDPLIHRLIDFIVT
jgi:Zn-dependent protease